jgi:hypothetical protein
MQREAPQLAHRDRLIRDWPYLSQLQRRLTRRTIQQFNASVRWAQESDMYQNPLPAWAATERPPRPGETHWPHSPRGA